MKNIVFAITLFIVSGTITGQNAAGRTQPEKNLASTEKELSSKSSGNAIGNKANATSEEEKPLVLYNDRVLKISEVITTDTIKNPTARSKDQEVQRLENEKKKKGN